MNRDELKQRLIEEMAKIICKPTANKGNCEKCGFKRSCSKFDDATDLYNAGFRKQNEWIPVTERLPERFTHIIVCDENGTVGEAYHFEGGRFEWLDDEELAFATHWMPLPEPPERSDAE